LDNRTRTRSIPYGQHSLDDDDIAAVVEVLRHSPLTQGPKITQFEEAVCRFTGARHAVAVSSGTAALHLACLAVELGPGGRLVTSPITFAASANCALYTGAAPAFADINGKTLNMDPQGLADVCARWKKVDVIIPVHYAGLPCDMPAIRAVAERHHAILIEDGAHALGATYPHGGRVGNCSLSAMTIFSFHPVKMIAAGEGGMITTNDTGLYRRLMRLRSHGINKLDDPVMNTARANTDGQPNPWYYEMQELGFNYRITDIQAALALSQLKRIDLFLARRREIAETYDAALNNLPGITLPQRAGRAYSAHHLYPVRIDFKKLKTTRCVLMEKLRKHGIGTQVHYIPVYSHPYYKRFGIHPEDFPQSESYYAEALSLPIFFSLTPDEQHHIITTLKGLLP
jgi:UDP-4-amino-4,6-dideoxy-N-acetyl-beta-L-altrosamine transaminase